MNSDGMKDAAIEKYVNFKRVQKSLETQNVTDKEVELQVQIAEIKLQSYGIDYSKLTF